MNGYRVEFSRPARKELEALPDKTQDRILSAIERLEGNPRPSGSKKLKGSKVTYRIRVGDYRVVYEVHDKDVLVLIIRVRDRKDRTEPHQRPARFREPGLNE